MGNSLTLLLNSVKQVNVETSGLDSSPKLSIKVNCMGVAITWLSQFGEYKGNLNDWWKWGLALIKFQDDIFFLNVAMSTYWISTSQIGLTTKFKTWVMEMITMCWTSWRDVTFFFFYFFSPRLGLMEDQMGWHQGLNWRVNRESKTKLKKKKELESCGIKFKAQ